jgi:predicted nucleotidyltransferase
MKISEIQEKLSPLLREYGIKRAAVFGSVSRGEDRPDSDVDILVTLGEKPMGMFIFMELIRRAEEKLGRKIDLVTEGALNRFVRPYITKDLKTIYEG